MLLPALFDGPLDYRVPANAAPGSIVTTKLAGRNLTGVLWDGAPDPSIPPAKIKPVTALLDLPPLPQPMRRWLDWMADYTLAPRGMVLALCGLSHAVKTTRTRYNVSRYVPQLPTLTAQQQEAVDVLLNSSPPVGEAEKPILLDGVTGSGKTEVYFHAIAQQLAAGKQVLVLLPEIALTHQWLERFEKQFGAPPALWHSHATPATRSKIWQAVARNEAKIVVGARSALFLPFADLGLIVVDEEHDPSYKQDEGVQYHARDMAVARARFCNTHILLVSATPSLETLLNVQDGKYRVVHLPSRFGAAGMPEVALVDMRAHPPERGSFLSPRIITELAATLARGEQALLFLNRRGYAPLLLCRGCGHRFQCSNCSAWLVVHGKNTRLECHHCGHREPMPKACPNCEAPAEKLAACGPGVERIAEEVRALFPSIFSIPSVVPQLREPPRQRGQERSDLGGGAPPFTPEGHTINLAVLSSDESIASDTWAAIEQGEIDLLVGTQMVAKGHHFPRLTFVAVVDADVGLQGADLRAGERTFQLLHQLGGRAGRGEAPGKVLIQTTQPQHPIMKALCDHDRDAVMTLEADLRRQGGWPPYGQLAAIILDGPNDADVRRFGQELARLAPQDARLRVLGPAPAPLSRLRGQYRYRLLVKAAPGLHLQKTLRAWLKPLKSKTVRLTVDVNPYYFM